MKIKISPSLLAADFLHLEDSVIRADRAGVDMFHCDVMDGVYVPNISFGFDIIKKVGSVTDVPLDVHMMTVCPEKYIDVLKSAGAYNVTVHSDYADETTVIECLKSIREAGMRASVSLKPKCTAESLTPFLPYIDSVLIMTVEPGFGGQKFMADMLPKVTAVRAMLPKGAEVQVDGGVSRDNVQILAEAGADSFVVGTALFKAADMAEETEYLRKLTEKI